MNKEKNRRLVLASILSALIIVMTVIPYTGYIYYGLIEITTLHIVVIIGACYLGWKYGMILGFVWGASCMIRAFTNPLWAPFTNPVVSVAPRIFVGLITGMVYEGLKKCKIRNSFASSVSAAAGTVTNTVLVLSALSAFGVSFGGKLISTIYSTLISLNGVIELLAAVIITPIILAAIQPHELVLGIDFGSSTTKIVLVQNRRCIRSVKIEKEDELEEAVNRIGGNAASRISVTGVGSGDIGESLFNKPVKKVDEFLATSKGASRCSGLFNFLVTNIGTGTSFVRVSPFRQWHVGGSGLGGGTLYALAGELCGTQDMTAFKNLAEKGELSSIDLQVKDLCESVPDLQPTSTVSNLRKIDSLDKQEDIAAGICNMIFENIGVMSALAVKRTLTRKIVLVGTISEWPIAKRSLDEVAKLYNVRFFVPDNAPYITAIGTTLID